jgi:CPA2 family monovalent cation:H+ antiporter-2
MAHLPHLLSDLVLILIAAGVITIVFKWLKQPVVLGYIVAGFLVGPHMAALPSVSDKASIEVWSEIGIIFLLFALGLEFRIHKLIKVGSSALMAAIINMGAMIAIGYVAGMWLGWTSIESIFLGGMLSMASTTIILKTFTEMGKQNQYFATIVFAILIIEDIAAILMMVLFSTLAISKTVEGEQLIDSLFKLTFFIVVWFSVGIFLIPTIIRRVRRFLNDETLLIVSVGLCLGMVLLASSVGFSAALGAFIMGTILAESVEAKRIEHLMEPLKFLFGAVFFVSVGMMIEPLLIADSWDTILILTLVVIVGRIVFATLGTLIAGESLHTAMQAGFSLAQIGEFSFIIATLGIQLGVLNKYIYPIIVSVSVITTFTTPYAIRYVDKVYGKIAIHIPPTWKLLLNGYTAERKRKRKQSGKQHPAGMFDFKTFLRKFVMPAIIYYILALATHIVAKMYLMPFVAKHSGGSMVGDIISAVITLLGMAPFLYGILRHGAQYFRTQDLFLMSQTIADDSPLPIPINTSKLSFRQQLAIMKAERRRIKIRRQSMKDNLLRHRTKIRRDGRQITRLGVLLMAQIPRAMCVTLIVMVLAPLFPLATGILVLIALGILILISRNPISARQSTQMEKVFKDNFSLDGESA